MRLDLSQIRQAETALVREYEPEAFPEGEWDYRVVAPVALRMTIYKDHARYRLAGTVVTTLQLQCSRCLESFVLPVDGPFDLRYLPPNIGQDGPGNEKELGDDDLSTTFYQDDEIDLGVLLQEQFYLALPMKPLCKPACKGICSQCGLSLNVETCRCEVRWEDPRMAGLKAILSNRKPDDA